MLNTLGGLGEVLEESCKRLGGSLAVGESWEGLEGARGSLGEVSERVLYWRTPTSQLPLQAPCLQAVGTTLRCPGFCNASLAPEVRDEVHHQVKGTKKQAPKRATCERNDQSSRLSMSKIMS